MSRCEQLRPNFYGCDLYYGKIDMKKTHVSVCFFLVNHKADTEFIKKRALQLILAGCKSYEFFGKYSEEWHLALDLADISINPDSNEESVAITVSHQTIEDFVDSLNEWLSCRSIVPYDYYLIYDDVDLYDQVKTMLKY